MKIAIAGVPRAGKTTFALQLAHQLSLPLVHGDDFISMGWSEASAEVARRLVYPGDFIVEGVVVLRALRKAIELSPERPCDRLHWFGEARQALSKGQAAMAEADRKRLIELRAELERRGVQIVDGAMFAATHVPVAPPAVIAQQPAAPKQAAVPAIESRWSGSSGRGFG